MEDMKERNLPSIHAIAIAAECMRMLLPAQFSHHMPA
jgi:hypothetical protein